MASLFDSLCAQLHAEPDRKGEVWIDCPQCGKDKKHFSFSERGGHCFACDYSASLRTIAALLNIQPDDRRPTTDDRRPTKPPRPDLWQREPQKWLERYGAPLDRVQVWQRYKPVSLDSIGRFHLGVGKLPLWSEERRHWYEYPYRRLIVPVWDEQGHLVAFHGRACSPNDDGPKWLSASGSNKRVLFLAGDLRPGCTLVIVENYVDAILAHETAPEAVYAALGGATWQDAWTAQIAAVRPRNTLIWLDHDLAGNGSRYHERELLRLWREAIEARRAANPALAARPFPQPPEPRGPRIANALLEAGVLSQLYTWPRQTPLKADLGWVLMQERRAA